MVIIDTSIWVDVLRPGASAWRSEFTRLAEASEAANVGIIYAEVLRGAKDEDDLVVLRQRLDALQFLESSKRIWELAGRLLSDLSRQGNIIPFQDAVIAAHALEGGHQVFTTDGHFQLIPELRVYAPLAGPLP